MGVSEFLSGVGRCKQDLLHCRDFLILPELRLDELTWGSLTLSRDFAQFVMSATDTDHRLVYHYHNLCHFPVVVAVAASAKHDDSQR